MSEPVTKVTAAVSASMHVAGHNHITLVLPPDMLILGSADEEVWAEIEPESVTPWGSELYQYHFVNPYRYLRVAPKTVEAR